MIDVRNLFILAVLVAPTLGAQAVVRGEVYDSLVTNAPLAGATIVVDGTARTATTDRRGRFVLRDLPAGAHTFGFFHPMFDSLGIGAPRATAEVGAKGSVKVALATPSANGLSLRACGRTAEPATAVVFGVARAAEDSSLLANALARVRWFEFELNGAASRQVEKVETARTGDDGRYVLCGVPNDLAVSLVVEYEGQTTGAMHLAIDNAGIARRDALISLSDTAARRLPDLRPDDTLPVRRPPGSARVRVTVRNAQGRPVRGAIVGIRGTTSSATTDEAGRAILNAVPAGSQTLVVRAIGLSPSLQVVSLRPNADLPLEISLEKFALLLKTVTVVGLRPVQLDIDYARRQKTGWGYYFQGAALLGASGGLGWWAGIPGMSMAGSSGSDAMPLMKSTFHSYCVPTVWMDGFQVSQVDGWELRSLLMNAHRMEVYTSPTRVPPEFSGSGAEVCGAIVIWTR